MTNFSLKSRESFIILIECLEILLAWAMTYDITGL